MEPLTLPIAAQTRIREIEAQKAVLQEQLRNFVSGVLVGLGVDIDNPNLSVDLDSMTVSEVVRDEAPAE